MERRAEDSIREKQGRDKKRELRRELRIGERRKAGKQQKGKWKEKEGKKEKNNGRREKETDGKSSISRLNET